MARDGEIASRADSSRSSLSWLGQSWNFRAHRLSNLIVLSSEQHEVVGGSSLKLFASYSFEMLHIIFTNTRIISSNDLIKTLLHRRSHGSMSMLLLLDSTRVWQFITSSSWNSIFITDESIGVDTKWFRITSKFGCIQIFCLIFYVILGSWICQLMTVLNHIGSL